MIRIFPACQSLPEAVVYRGAAILDKWCAPQGDTT